jgi:hypothetical protein
MCANVSKLFVVCKTLSIASFTINVCRRGMTKVVEYCSFCQNKFDGD